MRQIALSVLACLSAASLLAQTQTPPVFRTEASLVEVIVRVTDERGQFVPNLTQNDFEVRDRGRAQAIVAFNYRNSPRRPVAPLAAGPPLVVPDMSTVSTNASAGDGRLYVLVLDDLGTSSSYTIPVRMAARDFVLRYVEPTDLIAIFPTGGRGVLTQEFTNDRVRALTVIDRFWGTGFCEGRMARATAHFVEALSAHLSDVRGRKVTVVWMSESGLQMWDADQRRAIYALRRANLGLVVVDPRKLFYPVEMMTLGDGEVAQSLPKWGEVSCGQTPSLLREFAEQAGGFAAVDTNDLSAAFERVVEEASQYYVLGFQPTNPPRPGEFRDIEIRVPSHPRWRISGRPGYAIPRPQPPGPRPTDVRPVLADAIVKNLPTAGLPMQVQAVPRRGPSGESQVHVLVEVDANDLKFQALEGKHQERLEFALRTIDFLARSGHNTKTSVTVTVNADQLEQTRRAGVRWLSTLDVAPGRYSLRVAGHAVTTGQTGAVFLDVDVPKWESDTLWIGGLVVTAAGADQSVTASSFPPALGLPGPPTTARRFARGRSLTASAQIVAPSGFRGGVVQMAVHPQFARPNTPPLLAHSLDLPDRATAELSRSWSVSTAALPDGEYVLRLTVKETGGRSADTAMLFEVGP